MKKSLRHLPKHKRDELRALVPIICEIIPNVEMIILFGSYARGTWVEDRYREDGTTYEYKSDYDLLILVENVHKAQNKGYRKRIRMAARHDAGCNTRLSLILHSVDEVNDALRDGSYFFADMKKEGILLFDSGTFKLARRKALNLDERREKAKENFELWFKDAKDFYKLYELSLEAGLYKKAAFLLHQAAENYYHTTLMVFTDYKPKLHDLEELGVNVSRLDARLKGAFPRNTEEERRLFNLLKRAYIDARYKKSYRIEKEELESLAERVRILQELTEQACNEKIAQMS